MGCGVGHGADYEGNVGARWKAKFGVVAFKHCGWVGSEVFHGARCENMSKMVMMKWCMSLLEAVRS